MPLYYHKKVNERLPYKILIKALRNWLDIIKYKREVYETKPVISDIVKELSDLLKKSEIGTARPIKEQNALHPGDSPSSGGFSSHVLLSVGTSATKGRDFIREKEFVKKSLHIEKK